MSDKNQTYKLKKTANKRWGIYLNDRLLATVGSYEVSQSIKQYLSENLSSSDTSKAAIAYNKAINRASVINKQLEA